MDKKILNYDLNNDIKDLLIDLEEILNYDIREEDIIYDLLNRIQKIKSIL